MDIFKCTLLLAMMLFAFACTGESKQQPLQSTAVETAVQSLIERHGEAHASRIETGVRQVSERWWDSDGDEAEFSSFCENNFIADEGELARTFLRLQSLLEQVDGHLHEVRREILAPLELDTGPIPAVDNLFSAVDLAAHVDDDLYRSKVAFLALLNFPVHTLADRLERGDAWDRETWARSRMMDRFAQRVPAEVSQEISRAFTEADRYIADYNIRMDRLVTGEGERLFPEGLRLITHWGLRDELKSQYPKEDGLRRQKMILQVMERIISQEIPAEVIDNGDLLWDPHGNRSWRIGEDGQAEGEPLTLEREQDNRYAYLLDIFHAVRAADRYTPATPSYIKRKFERTRQVPEEEVEALLASILKSDEFKKCAALISDRLGRPLEPFDIWYNGFKAQGEHDEAELDRIVSRRYPDVAAFSADLPRILTDLGFTADKAAWLAERIIVDPSRGAGHATGAVRREDQAHLRTRVGKGGMDYKGYNIAIHELGHNVEQVFSLNGIDHWWMQGVPNNAFTEAMAFLFQNRDLELLGLAPQSTEARQMEALDTLWSTAEIGGVSLVDMKVWRWMYEHPEATPAELNAAARSVAREVWNDYFAPVFGSSDQEILAIYSHMIVYGLYLPDYAIGHIVGFQVADNMRQADFGKEFERITRQGRLTPDAWMRTAVGQPLSAGALLAAAEEALQAAGSGI
jgi:hypothetical protein